LGSCVPYGAGFYARIFGTHLNRDAVLYRRYILMISQEELEKYAGYKVKLKEKQKKIKLAEAQLKDMEASFVQRLETKERVEKGRFIPKIKEELKRASIAWKDVVIKLKGLAFVEKMIQGAKRDPVKKFEVVDEG